MPQVVTKLIAPQQPGDPAERLHVRSGGALGSDQEEEQLDRPSIQGVVIDRLPRDTGGENELIDRGGLAVRDGDTAPDARAQDLFPIPDGAEDRLPGGRVETWSREVDKLAQHVILGSGIQRYLDAIRGEQLSELHGGPW